MVYVPLSMECLNLPVTRDCLIRTSQKSLKVEACRVTESSSTNSTTHCSFGQGKIVELEGWRAGCRCFAKLGLVFEVKIEWNAVSY